MAGYTRVDTINNIADGNVINAADLDGEFNGIQAAFDSSTGHNHDGTVGEGAPILALGPSQDVTISASVLGVKTTNTVDLGTTGLKFKDFYLAGAASIGGALTYGGVTLSSAVTGTGNMVLSASPTLTGTITAAAANFSGAVALNGNTTLGDADTDTITQAASYVTGTVLRSAKLATNTLALAAYDVDGTAYTNLITLTAANAPTLTLTSTGVGTINNMSIGATTASTGAFTTLSATGAVTFNTTSNAQSYTTTGAGTIAISSGTAGTINNMSIGATTRSTGAFTTVGIGTIYPSVNLEVSGSNGSTWSATLTSISGTTMTIAGAVTGTIAIGDLVYGTGVQPYTRITAGSALSWTVSVSQTVASATLVGGATYSNTLIRITDTDTSQAAGQPTGGLQFFTSDASSPTAGVGAYVAAMAEDASPDTALIFGTRDDGGGGVDANERMRIDSAGNVGIGTSSPTNTLSVAGNANVTGNITLGDADTDTITENASYVAGTQLKSAKAATNTLNLAAYDVDGTAYTNLITLTASNTPTLTLTSTGVGTINNMSIGATTAAAGTFTTLSSTGNTTLGDAVADTITVNGQFVTGTVLRSAQTATNTLALAAYDVDGAAYTNLITLTAANAPTLALTSTGVGTINNMSVGATTAATGAFTTLSATGVTTVQAGTAALPAITTTGDTNTGIWFPAADTIAFTEGGVESMRIDSSGNVGIGTTSPAYGTLEVAQGSAGVVSVINNTVGAWAFRKGRSDGSSGMGIYDATGFGVPAFYAAGSERMRIDSSGDVGIGTSSPTALRTRNLEVSSSGTNDGAAIIANKRGTGIATMRLATVGAADGFDINYNFPNTGMLGFYDLAAATTRVAIDSSGNLLVGTTSSISGNAQITIVGGGTNRGALQMGRTTAATTGVAGSLVAYNGSNAICGIDWSSNGANNSGYIGTFTYNAGTFAQGPYVNTGGTSWTTASDERLKNVTGEITDALNKISQIRAVEFTWKADSLNKQNIGFIAQDVQAVLPEVIDTDTNGHLGVRYAEVTPLLLAAIKEQQSLITSLTTRLTALESK